jgi:hypothetical protein
MTFCPSRRRQVLEMQCCPLGRCPHNPKVGGSNPPPATKTPSISSHYKGRSRGLVFLVLLLLGVWRCFRVAASASQLDECHGFGFRTQWRDLWELRPTIVKIGTHRSRGHQPQLRTQVWTSLTSASTSVLDHLKDQSLDGYPCFRLIPH